MSIYDWAAIGVGHAIARDKSYRCCNAANPTTRDAPGHHNQFRAGIRSLSSGSTGAHNAHCNRNRHGRDTHNSSARSIGNTDNHRTNRSTSSHKDTHSPTTHNSRSLDSHSRNKDTHNPSTTGGSNPPQSVLLRLALRGIWMLGPALAGQRFTSRRLITCSSWRNLTMLP